MKKRPSTRRQFLSQIAGAGAAGALTGCVTAAGPDAPEPFHVAKEIPERRALGANDRIQCGFIGIGSRGSSLLGSVLSRNDVDVVALADIYTGALEKAAARCRTKVPNVRTYVMFEELLEKEKLDAIVIATPDHIHAPAILTALDLGCDVYTEKPMTLTWEEAEHVRRRVHEVGAVLQVGTQLRSKSMYQQAREFYQSGKLGTLVAVRANRDSKDGGFAREIPTTDPSQVRWDLFLRDTKPYPYDPNRVFNWRRYVEYSNGPAGDLMLHHLDIFHFVTGCSMPDRVMSTGGLYVIQDGRTCPDTISVLLEYPEKFQFNFSTTFANGHYDLKECYLGTEGTMEIHGMSELALYCGDAVEKFPSPGILNEPHLENFFHCMRTRETPIAPVDAGCMGATCCHMAVLSERSGNAAKWDAATRTVTI